MGFSIEAYDGSSAEIRYQIALGKSAITKLWNVTCNWKVSKETRKRLIRTLAFSVVLYATETWTLKAAD